MILTDSEKLLIKLMRVYLEYGYTRAETLQKIADLAKKVK
jgi:hypothetical protein